ncbi:hypothetical protein GZH53_16255 [Flavihumibacter sp. R14]|nr:hypothetical protein [Flavihumibacter soli]
MFTAPIFFWLLGCLALGAGYALLLYRWQTRLDKSLRNILFVLRTLAVAAITFLLFAPPIKTTDRTSEKPLIILAQDNSQSINVSKAAGFNPVTYAEQFRALEKALSEEYDVRSFSFGAAVDRGLKFRYDGKLTNLASVFQMIDNDFANRNVGAVIVASDGIYNKGGNPVYESKNLKAPVYSVALGDTVPKKDLLISNVNYNNIAYLDNQFQIEVSVEAFQSQGAVSRLTVADQSGTLFTRQLAIGSNEFRLTVPISLPAKRRGIQRYTINLSPVANELSKENNTQTIFVEVIDGRQNVLIIANAPHPDIAALRQSIEINKNYEVQIAYADDVNEAAVRKAGLVILHQLPSLSNTASKLQQQLSAKPVLYVLGAQSSPTLFSTSQDVLNINSSGTTQEVLARVSPDFYGFTLSDNSKTKLQGFAPLIAPFGNYGVKGPATVALLQQIGKVSTNIPLLIFGGDQQRKVGVLAGEGIWRWRLEEFQESNSHEAVNELISKTIQYLSTRDDKRKFRIYPAKNSFDENEQVILNAELYNDAYELINEPDVNVSLKNRDGKGYSFLFSRIGNAYTLDAGSLPAGEYTFDGKTRLGNKEYKAGGQFVIRHQQAELQQTTANHQLLFALADQNGGQMIYPEQLSKLPQLIDANENIKTVVYEDRKYEEAVNYKLLFFLIISLLTAEWFFRKRNGEV